jgi:hypothetical protein
MEENNWSLRSPEGQPTIELDIVRRQLQSVNPEVQMQLNLRLVEDKCSLWSLKYNCNWTWQLELPDGYFLLQRIAIDARRWCREEGSEGRRDRKQEVETQEQTVLTLGLDQITKFVYRLDGPLGEGNV